MAFNIHKLSQTITCFSFCNSSKQFPDWQLQHVMIFNNLTIMNKNYEIEHEII